MAKKKRRTATPNRTRSSGTAPSVDYDDQFAAPGDRRGYRHSDHGNVGGTMPTGNHFLKPGTRAKFHYPSYKKGRVIVRPFPSLSLDRKKIERVRLSAKNDDLGAWLVQFPAVDWAGFEDTFSMFLYNPADPSTGTPESNPYMVLYRNLTSAITQGADGIDPKWIKYVPKRGESDYKMKVKKPVGLGFFQGLIYQSDGECHVAQGKKPVGARDGDLPVIIQISEPTKRSLTAKLNVVNEEYQGADTNFEKYFLYGDPVHPGRGRFICIYNPQLEDLGHKYADQKAMDESRRNKEGYATALLTRFSFGDSTWKPNLIDNPLVDESIIKRNWLEWEEVFHFPSQEEQCTIIARGFKEDLGPAMLQYAWARNPEFLTDEVCAILGAKKHFDMATEEEDEEELEGGEVDDELDDGFDAEEDDFDEEEDEDESEEEDDDDFDEEEDEDGSEEDEESEEDEDDDFDDEEEDEDEDDDFDDEEEDEDEDDGFEEEGEEVDEDNDDFPDPGDDEKEDDQEANVRRRMKNSRERSKAVAQKKKKAAKKAPAKKAAGKSTSTKASAKKKATKSPTKKAAAKKKSSRK